MKNKVLVAGASGLIGVAAIEFISVCGLGCRRRFEAQTGLAEWARFSVHPGGLAR